MKILTRTQLETAEELFGYLLTFRQTCLDDYKEGKLVIPKRNIIIYCQAEIPKKAGHRTIFIPSPELWRCDSCTNCKTFK